MLFVSYYNFYFAKDFKWLLSPHKSFGVCALPCGHDTDSETTVFSAPEPKAQVHYCDHVLSVVRRR